MWLKENAFHLINHDAFYANKQLQPQQLEAQKQKTILIYHKVSCKNNYVIYLFY